jgi:hypothetical protein
MLDILVGLMMLSTALELTEPEPPGSWQITAYNPNGEVVRFGFYRSEEACEADIPKVEREHHVTGATCAP